MRALSVAATVAAVALLLTASRRADASPGGLSATAVAPNQAQNTQTSTGVINQSPLGGVNSNYQVNNAYETDFGFGPGIYCRTPGLVLGAYGGSLTSSAYSYNSSSGNYGGIVGFHIPLGGSVGSSCAQLAQEIAKQRRLDTDLAMIRQCAALKRGGVKLDYEIFPDFKPCDGVTLLPGDAGKTEEVARD